MLQIVIKMVKTTRQTDEFSNACKFTVDKTRVLLVYSILLLSFTFFI